MLDMNQIVTSSWGRGSKDPVVRPAMLTRGTLETLDLAKTRLLGDTLGFECRELSSDRMLMRHRSDASRKPYWVLEVQRVDTLRSPQKVTNHWGLWVPTKQDVDAANQLLQSRKEELGLLRIQAPHQAHANQRDYGFYFMDFSQNWWEISEDPGEEFIKFFSGGDWDKQEGAQS
jgi:hypothetical protein